jgi:hypothetical protein
MTAVTQMMQGNGFSNEYLKTYTMCKDFHCLPFAGGLFDQPAIYVEAFELIQSVINQYKANRKEGDHGR